MLGHRHQYRPASRLAKSVLVFVAILALGVTSAGADSVIVTNLGQSANTNMVALAGGGFAFGLYEGEGGSDQNGDGDLDDYTVIVWDGTQFIDLGVATTAGAPVPLADGGLAFVANEYNESADLNGDGDTFDLVVQVWDGVLHNLALAVDYGSLTPLEDGDLAFLVSEQEQSAGGSDLNGDGDTADLVLHIWNGNSVINLGLANGFDYGFFTQPVLTALRGGGLAFAVPESGQGGVDLTGNGTADDVAVYVWDGASATNLGVALTNSVLVPLDGGGVTFPSAEYSWGPTDLNGDVDVDDVVLFDWSSGTLTNTGWAYDGSIPVALDGGGFVFLAYEYAQGETDLDGDGDAFDGVLAVWDGGAVTNLAIAPAFNWRIALDGGGFAFTRYESSGPSDMNGDGDATDYVVHVWKDGVLTNLGIANFGYEPLALNGGGLAIVVFELHQGATDLNGDGDINDAAVLHVWDGTTVTDLGYVLGNYGRLPNGGFLFLVEEAGQGADLNGDGDVVLDHMLFASLGGIPVGVGVASDGDAGYIVLADGRVAFFASEPRNGGEGVGLDLNGDSDIGDVVIHIAEFAGEGPVDQTSPTVTITTPSNDAVYAKGVTVVADYDCADEVDGSGIATCAGPIADGSPIGTSVGGAFAFTVTATDNAGNIASTTANYSVIAEKDACKKGGWQNFTAPVFKNQGDCVSYFARMK